MDLIISATLLGLMGSVHCLGMCGPLVFSLSLNSDEQRGWIGVARAVFYHLMRVVSYGVIGITVGVVGEGLKLVVAQSYLSIFSGIILILWAGIRLLKLGRKISFLKSLLTWGHKLEKLENQVKQTLNRIIGYGMRNFRKDNFLHLGFIGFLNGWLPCGLVYAAATAAVGYGRLDQSFLFMIIFGLATFPMMVGAFFLFGKVTSKLRSRVEFVVPIVFLILGVMLIFRGLRGDAMFTSHWG